MRKTCFKCTHKIVCEIYRQIDSVCYKFPSTLTPDILLFMVEPLAEHCKEYKEING